MQFPSTKPYIAFFLFLLSAGLGIAGVTALALPLGLISGGWMIWEMIKLYK